MGLSVLQEKLTYAKAFIFDLDGTLVNLETLNHESFAYVTDAKFGRDLSIDEYAKYFAGRRSKDGFTKYCADYGVEDCDLDEYYADFNKRKGKILREQTGEVVELKSDVLEFLELLKRENRKIAIGTSTRRKYAELILVHFDLRKYFDVVRVAEDVRNGKPDPEMYELVLEDFSLEADEAVIFEDSINGIHAAKAAGVFCVGVRNGDWNKDVVNEADVVVDGFGDCINVFDI